MGRRRGRSAPPGADTYRLEGYGRGARNGLGGRGVPSDLATDPLPPPDPATDTGLVYAFLAGPFVKIGFTSGTIEGRMRELSTGCPYAIRCIGWRPGSLVTEAHLHARYARYRSHLEWFKLPRPVLAQLARDLPRRFTPET
jgi:Meiotically up-regulated gene 113